MIDTKLCAIYSVQHTGTWFTYSALSSIAYEKVYVRHDPTLDKWNLKDLSKKWTRPYFTKYLLGTLDGTIQEVVLPFDIFVVQGHHELGPESPFCKSLRETTAELDIRTIVPVRDPLLSINSLVWRKYGTLEALRQASDEVRTKRARLHMLNFVELLDLPDRNAFKFAIDTKNLASIESRIGALRSLAGFCNMSTDESKLYDFARDWQPVNHTKDDRLYWQQRIHDKVDDSAFQSIKDAILHRDVATVRKYLGPEFEYLRDQAHFIGDRFTRLGYEDLLWWG